MIAIKLIWHVFAFIIFAWLAYGSYKQLQNLREMIKTGESNVKKVLITEYGELVFEHSNIQKIIEEFLKIFRGLTIGGVIAAIISALSALLSIFFTF